MSFLRTISRGTVEFEHAKAAKLAPVMADAAQLHQVLMNIGTNAVHAMRGGRGVLAITEEEVSITTELQAQSPALQPGRYVRIGIRDTGAGMTAEVRERIFEPFYTTKAPGEGTGLGLSVVHGIMEQHGGAVTVYSQLGRGSLFHLYFPVAPDQARADFADVDLVHVPVGSGERVLFVDDDAVVAKTAERILKQLGYHVTTHTQPMLALEQFASAQPPFAVVMSDLTMPGCTGLELAAHVRALRPQIPFILASGFFSVAEEEHAEALRITQLLHKPLTSAALGRALAKSLRRDYGASSPIL